MQDINIARALYSMMDTESLPKNKFSSSERVIMTLKEYGVIDVKKNKGKRGHTVYKSRHFDDYVARHYHGDPKQFIDEEERGALFDKYGDDKSKNIRTQKGLMVWSDDNIEILPGFRLNCPEDVTVTIDREDISIPHDVKVIGVENYESLKKAKRLKCFFDQDGKTKCLFIARNKEYNDFLRAWEGENLWYFPDYDIFGVRIYETEILKSNKLVKVFIPDNLEEVFEKTDGRKLYLEQINSDGGGYKAFTSVGSILLSIMKNHKKVVRQEYFHKI